MNIFAINFTCPRDQDMADLMIDTLVKYAVPFIKQIRSIDTTGSVYGNGAGWKASMMKLDAIGKMLQDYKVKDNDFILSVDSDVVFTSPDVFDAVSARYGILGTQHKPPYPTKLGPWGHMSGALIFIRGDIAKQMAAKTWQELDRIRQEDFKGYVIPENEDVVLSYLAKLCGAESLDLPGNLSSGNFEHELISGDLKSFYHLNYLPGTFLLEECPSKWHIPSILKMKGIEL